MIASVLCSWSAVCCNIMMLVQESMNKDGTMKMTGFQQAMQKAKEASSVITLTGWIAVASVLSAIFLSIWGAVWLYRRYAGIDKPYTLLVSRDRESSSGS